MDRLGNLQSRRSLRGLEGDGIEEIGLEEVSPNGGKDSGHLVLLVCSVQQDPAAVEPGRSHLGQMMTVGIELWGKR